MITLALVGIGKWGKNYMNGIALMPNCKLKYVCASSNITLKKIPNHFEKSTNYKSLLKKKDIDGVIIATPPKTHFKIASAFISEGFNVLIEKPMVISLDEASALEKISEKKHPKIMVGHTYLFNPAFIKLKNSLIKVGEIRQFIFEGTQSIPRSDVSVIWDWGPHPTSILLDLFNTEPESIKIAQRHIGKNRLIDSLKVNMKVGKISVRINISWFGRKRRKIIIKGAKGNLILNDLNKLGYKLSFLKRKDKEQKFLRYKKSLPLTEEVKQFSQKIIKGAKTNSDVEFGTKVVKILSRIESLASTSIKNKVI